MKSISIFSACTTLFALTALAQTPPSTTTTYYPAKPLPGAQYSGPMMAMPSMAPLFIQDDRISSSLMLVNNAANSAGATITVRSLDGFQIISRHVVLAGTSQREVPLKELLSDERKVPELGNISVLQDEGLQGAAINAQLLLTDNRNSTLAHIDEELAMPSAEGSSMLRGVVDEADGPPILAIVNLVAKTQIVEVRCLSEKSRSSVAQISVAPHGTSLTSACSKNVIGDLDAYLRALPHHEEGAVSGIEIISDAGPGTLAAFALAPHRKQKDIVFSSIPFGDPALLRSSTTIYAGVPFGEQTALPDGFYVPHVAITNFSDKPANVRVSLVTSNEKNPADGELTADILQPPQANTLALAARESREVVFNDAHNQSGLLHSITVKSDQPSGQVQSKVVSRGDGDLYQVELLGKDSSDQENAGGHPWTTSGDYESHLLLFNHDAKATHFTVQIIAGSANWKKTYILASNETREISINQLIADGTKDDEGHSIGSSNRIGVVYWSTGEPKRGTGRLLVSSRSAVLARNFSCGYTYVVCGMGLSVYNGGFIPILGYTDYSNVAPQYCLAWGPGACSNLTQVGSGGGASFSWTLGNQSIVNFNTPSDQYSGSPNLKGLQSGSTYALVSTTENGCGSSGSGSPPPQVQVCPTSISISQPTTMPLAAQLSRWQTGIGIVTAMQTNPTSTNHNLALITETVSSLVNTCPANIGDLCTGSSTFTVGTGGTSIDGEVFVGKQNIFYDSHYFASHGDLLTAGGVNSCGATCSQTYRCGTNSVGNFTINYTLTKGTIGTTHVTLVNVQKH